MTSARRPADRTIRYQHIADELRTRVEGGEYLAGRLLPSEAELSQQYQASRVTIRRALEALRAEGLVSSRQGFGWFVATDPLRQSLGRLGTIEAQLAALGFESERQILGFAFVPAPPRVQEVLGVDVVLEIKRLNLARRSVGDKKSPGDPFARVTVWCPEHLGARLSRRQVEASPLYELIDVPLGGATQTIGAIAASASDARLLAIPVGSPVLVCERITRDRESKPVLISEHVFPGHLTEFSVELPYAEASMAPSGLRLVE
ncbi:MAG: GntR family transcriptional regulator [Acidimicrobiales bacterium]